MSEVSFGVVIPRSGDVYSFCLQSTRSVGEAAVFVSEHLGQTSGYPSFARDDGTVLDRSASLAEAGIADGVTVELVDVGGAV